MGISLRIHQKAVKIWKNSKFHLNEAVLSSKIREGKKDERRAGKTFKLEENSNEAFDYDKYKQTKWDWEGALGTLRDTWQWSKIFEENEKKKLRYESLC